ncbi:shikimate 5-dehydrogenase [Kluyvera cryocrescens]|uniref:Shikimate 5-dehydrogenase n=1 Tax=Kluyvera cryocrescens TaxID=580 RepID=A0A485BPE4_KLUCR|nr:shikimate 5-dehydrogenase [Kluyvera cryocrescens]
MQISGHTRLIAHLGYPTASFKAPMIYNPWFENQAVDVKVVPMGVTPEDYAALIPALFSLTNICGALVTMPHKVATWWRWSTRLSPTAQIAGACNAIRRGARWFAHRGICLTATALCAAFSVRDFKPSVPARLVVGKRGRRVGDRRVASRRRRECADLV